MKEWRRQDKIVKAWKERADKIKGKIKLMAWNVQKANIDFPRGCRFAEILRYIRKTSVKIVFFSEITSGEHGILWIKPKKLFGKVIYGRKTAIFLRDDWAEDWEKQGCHKWISDRVVAAKVGRHKLVACYQPIWEKNEDEMRKYTEDLEEQMILKRIDEWPIIGGDFNSQVGGRDSRVETDTCGKYGLGRTNAAGEDLIHWVEINNLRWVNSFFVHPDRGTWDNKRYKTWHEIDGFNTTRQERIKLITNVRADSEFSLSNHKPKTMTIADKRPKAENQQFRKQGTGIDWGKLDCEEVRMNFQNEMNRKLGNKEKSGNGIS